MSKSALHRTVLNAREVERFVGFGGGYINPRHYFLVCGVANRPDSWKGQKPLRATYGDLFARQSDCDWDLEGPNRVLSYLTGELSHLTWHGDLHIIASPRLAALARRPEWFGNSMGIVIHTGPGFGIGHFSLNHLIASRPSAWHSRALRILRWLNSNSQPPASSIHWINEYLGLMEWRASRSPWKSVEFSRDADPLYAVAPNPKLSAQLLKAKTILESNQGERFRIFPIWD